MMVGRLHGFARVALLSAGVVLGISSVTQAVDTTGWCGTVTGGPVIACEDFDDYCADPPCDDAMGDDTPNQTAFLANWPSDGCLEADLTDPSVAWIAADQIVGTDPIEYYGSSLPFAGKQLKGVEYPNALGGRYITDGTSHRYSLLPRIAELDASKGSVNGTDENPLTVVFVLDMAGTDYDSAQANRYLELTDGSDRAASKLDLVTCLDGKVRPRVAVNDGFDHKALALGVFAATDPDPCDTSGARPLNYRLSVYNGNKWTELKPGIYGANNNGLYIRTGINLITMVIKSSIIEVQVDTTIANPDPAIGGRVPYTSNAVIPRTYLGGFAALHIGNGACLPSFKDDYIDDIAITGGVLGDPIPTGACCLPDTSCIEASTADGCVARHGGTYAGDGIDCATAQCPTPAGACCLEDASCQQLNAADCATAGGYFSGEFTTCNTVHCCPIPFADWDTDQDVDMEDFAEAQKCITIGSIVPVTTECKCFDRDGDDDVDLEDIDMFVNCSTGPSVPFDPNNPPTGCVPY